jgi:hypothetical protein
LTVNKRAAADAIGFGGKPRYHPLDPSIRLSGFVVTKGRRTQGELYACPAGCVAPQCVVDSNEVCCGRWEPRSPHSHEGAAWNLSHRR